MLAAAPATGVSSVRGPVLPSRMVGSVRETRYGVGGSQAARLAAGPPSRGHGRPQLVSCAALPPPAARTPSSCCSARRPSAARSSSSPTRWRRRWTGCAPGRRPSSTAGERRGPGRWAARPRGGGGGRLAAVLACRVAGWRPLRRPREGHAPRGVVCSGGTRSPCARARGVVRTPLSRPRF